MALCQQLAAGEANGQVDSRRQRYGASHRGRHAGPGSIRGVPLPLPVWAHYESPALTVPTVEQYEELAGSVELETQHLLREHRYDTIGNFLR